MLTSGWFALGPVRARRFSLETHMGLYRLNSGSVGFWLEPRFDMMSLVKDPQVARLSHFSA